MKKNFLLRYPFMDKRNHFVPEPHSACVSIEYPMAVLEFLTFKYL